jgi:hypothetical protein
MENNFNLNIIAFVETGKIRFGDKQTSNDILYGARHNCLAYRYSMV